MNTQLNYHKKWLSSIVMLFTKQLGIQGMVVKIFFFFFFFKKIEFFILFFFFQRIILMKIKIIKENMKWDY